MLKQGGFGLYGSRINRGLILFRSCENSLGRSYSNLNDCYSGPDTFNVSGGIYNE